MDSIQLRRVKLKTVLIDSYTGLFKRITRLLKIDREKSKAIKMLTSLGIWQETRTQGGMPAWIVKSSFKENLSAGIFEHNKANAQEEAQTIDARMIERLDSYAIERWEVSSRDLTWSLEKKEVFFKYSLSPKSILKYIVNPRDAHNQVCNSTKEVLKFAGLMKASDERTNDNGSSGSMQESDSVTLTAAAFQFLLWGRKVQIWYFIIQLLEYFWQVNKRFFLILLFK